MWENVYMLHENSLPFYIVTWLSAGVHIQRGPRSNTLWTWAENVTYTQNNTTPLIYNQSHIKTQYNTTHNIYKHICILYQYDS
jgi:hypothetical protein